MLVQGFGHGLSLKKDIGSKQKLQIKNSKTDSGLFFCSVENMVAASSPQSALLRVFKAVFI